MNNHVNDNHHVCLNLFNKFGLNKNREKWQKFLIFAKYFLLNFFKHNTKKLAKNSTKKRKKFYGFL
jgi:hypothetical protein